LNWQSVVSTQLDPESYKRLEAYCSRNQLYKAGIVREAILDYLGRKLKEEELDRLKELQGTLDKLLQINPNDHPEVQELLRETQKVLASLSGSGQVDAPHEQQ
jgi:predicted DNA-binding protein